MRGNSSVIAAANFLFTLFRRNYAYSDMTTLWLKRLGFWGFMFFLVKGLLWLIVPAFAVYLAN